jgi:hypothetical protein
VSHALDAILTQHQPFPAVVLDRMWNIVRANDCAERFFGFLLAGQTPPSPANVLRLIFHPEGLRPHIVNWEEVAASLIQRVHREAIGRRIDDDVHSIVAEVLAYPEVPATWRQPELTKELLPIVPVRFAREGRRFSYFSTVTTFGTPVDVTAQEIRIECFFPIDTATRDAAKAFG